MLEFEPLYTADEMRAAEARYPGSTAELMERAGAVAARVALQVFNDARRWTVVCGGGSRVVDAKAGDSELGEPEAIVDALFGTGFRGEPRPDARALIERINASDAAVL